MVKYGTTLPCGVSLEVSETVHGGLETSIITIFEEKDKDCNYSNTHFITVFSKLFKTLAWSRSREC